MKRLLRLKHILKSGVLRLMGNAISDAQNKLPYTIIRHPHGSQVDHIGLGVPDTKAGVEWLEEKMGADVYIGDPEPDQWYWSGSVSIGGPSFLEVIGPNPEHKGFQPFKTYLKDLDGPALLFWYVAVDNFSALRNFMKGERIPLQQVQEINIDAANPEQPGYSRGFVGPGFLSQRPNVIEWRHRPERIVGEGTCTLKEFRLSHPKADNLNTVFGRLGIDVPVSIGPSSLGVTIDTPNGDFVLDSPGMAWTGFRMLPTIGSLWLKHLSGVR
ncbi:MAG: VOC family protein [Pseudomonadota bacterium]